jgi:UrcA family protein
MDKHKAFRTCLLGTGLLAASFASFAEQQTVAMALPGELLIEVRSVHYRDLDLHAEAGVAELHRRLRSAATEVCGPYTNPASRAVVQACRNRALEGALAQVRAPALRAYNLRWKAEGASWLGSSADHSKRIQPLLSRR